MLLAVVAATLVAASAMSVAAQGQGEGATITKDNFCFAFLPPAPYVDSHDSNAVVSPNGNTTFTCHFEGPPIPETLNVDNFTCSTPAGDITTQTHFVYTKSGQATLICRV